MGKYMKKSKITSGDVAFMEVSSPQSSYIGVRTRAKTLALQNLQKSPSSASHCRLDASSFSYLELRSRRLQKQQQPPPAQLSKKCCGESPKTEFCGVVVNSRLNDEKEGGFDREIAKGSEAEGSFDVGIEGSFGENCLEVEGRDRSTRESTPCSLIRDSNTIDTPGSTTRQRSSTSTNQIINANMQRNFPTACEMEEFFAFAEKQQQAIFMDKYNFDIVNDVPLPGRYEWVQILH